MAEAVKAVFCGIAEFYRASCRPTITYALVAALIYLTKVDKVPAGDIVTLAGTAFGFWFGGRGAEKNLERERAEWDAEKRKLLEEIEALKKQ